MRNQTNKLLRSVSTKPKHHRSLWHFPGRKLLNKLEIWCELLGTFYGIIFPQEHPGLNVTLLPSSINKYQSAHSYLSPGKRNHQLKRSRRHV